MSSSKLSVRPYLTARLLSIADMARRAVKACDIGTDHAYIPIYLVSECGTKSAVAADIKCGPLKIAEKNIKKFSQDDKISTRLSDGMKNISPDDADTVIIAGMGGTLISQILTDSPHMKKENIRFVLQPMTAVSDLRRYLYENGYSIEDEALSKEDDKLYTVISARYTGVSRQDTEEVFLHIGKKLIEKRDPLCKTLILRKINECEKICEGLKKSSDSEECRIKLDYYQKLLKSLYQLSIKS